MFIMPVLYSKLWRVYLVFISNFKFQQSSESLQKELCLESTNDGFDASHLWRIKSSKIIAPFSLLESHRLDNAPLYFRKSLKARKRMK